MAACCCFCNKTPPTSCARVLLPFPLAPSLLYGPSQASSTAPAKPPLWWSMVTTVLLRPAAGSQTHGACPSATVDTGAEHPLLLDVLPCLGHRPHLALAGTPAGLSPRPPRLPPPLSLGLFTWGPSGLRSRLSALLYHSFSLDDLTPSQELC